MAPSTPSNSALAGMAIREVLQEEFARFVIDVLRPELHDAIKRIEQHFVNGRWTAHTSTDEDAQTAFPNRIDMDMQTGVPKIAHMSLATFGQREKESMGSRSSTKPNKSMSQPPPSPMATDPWMGLESHPLRDAAVVDWSRMSTTTQDDLDKTGRRLELFLRGYPSSGSRFSNSQSASGATPAMQKLPAFDQSLPLPSEGAMSASEQQKVTVPPLPIRKASEAAPMPGRGRLINSARRSEDASAQPTEAAPKATTPRSTATPENVIEKQPSTTAYNSVAVIGPRGSMTVEMVREMCNVRSRMTKPIRSATGSTACTATKTPELSPRMLTDKPDVEKAEKGVLMGSPEWLDEDIVFSADHLVSLAQTPEYQLHDPSNWQLKPRCGLRPGKAEQQQPQQ